ncbi:MAG TPA: RDD family protein [Chloroflexia bacterium]|nr:RDD family protein [Chloroflexia bacterium]
MKNQNYSQSRSYAPTYQDRPPTRPVKPALPDYRYTREFYRNQPAFGVRATWGPRLVAFIFDFLLVSIPFNTLGNLFWISKAVDEGDNITQTTYTFGIPVEVHNLLWLLVFGLYATLTTLLMGATIGKRIMNLKVVNQTGGSLNPLLLYLRYTAGYVISAVLLGGGFAWAIFDKQKQTLHDKIFRSHVVLADPTRI